MRTSGLPAGDAGEGLGNELEDLNSVLGLLLLGRRGDAGVPADGRAQLADLGELREEGDEVRGEIGEVGALGRGAGVAGLEVVLDELAEALVGEGAVLLDEAAVEDADLPDHGEVLELLEQARLADAGLAGHDGELGLARDGGVQASLQFGEFLFPADEDGARGSLDDAARGQDDRHPELVAREARPVALQGLGDLARLLGALARVLLEAAHQDVLELLADLRPEGARRLRDLVDDAVQDRLDLTGEGRLADEAFVEHDAERVDVRAAVEGPRGDLLGREVGDGPHERARLGEARLGGGVGEAEVHHAHAHARAAFLARDHDVGGLDVAVNDAARVAVVEGLGDLDADVHDLAEAQRLVADESQQGRPPDQRHDEEERPLVSAEIVDRDDRRVVHLGDQLRLALEALFELGRQIARRDELDGDLAVEQRVARAVDDAHAAAAELPEDLVAVGELRADHSLPANAGSRGLRRRSSSWTGRSRSALPARDARSSTPGRGRAEASALRAR